MFHRAGGMARVARKVAEAAFRPKCLLQEVDLNIAVEKSRALATIPGLHPELGRLLLGRRLVVLLPLLQLSLLTNLLVLLLPFLLYFLILLLFLHLLHILVAPPDAYLR